jgi:glycosyltransferase involved in cell wall biosynthesis
MQRITGGKKVLLQPIVSIIIVTYNAEKDIEECLYSIFNQKNQQYELIVFDGNSTDSTVSLLKKHSSSISYWQSEPDKGIYDAMNKAVSTIRGKWVYFLGADDKLLPGFSEMVDKLDKSNTIYYGDCSTDEGIYGGKFDSYKISKRNICQQGIFYAAEVFKKYHFNTSYRVYADYLLNIQCWGDSRFIKTYLPIKVCSYNLNGYSSFAIDDDFKNHKPSYIKKYLGRLIYFRYIITKLKRRIKGDEDFF